MRCRLRTLSVGPHLRNGLKYLGLLAWAVQVNAAPITDAPAPALTVIGPGTTTQPATPRGRHASQHILVQIAEDSDPDETLGRALALGLQKKQRLGASNWYTLALPPGIAKNAAQMAAEAGGLPGIASAVLDPILSINDTIPPTDPYYKDDPDPGNDCDLVNDPTCNAEDIVDQWGLFQVEAEGAWPITTGDPGVVIAVLDSGIDLDHDDLWANIWQNTAEVNGTAGVDDDGNGKVDDLYGYDFAGDNAGYPGEDSASEDNNPDLFSLPEHQWVADGLAAPFGYRFDGDAAVGDGIDNNLEYYPLFFTIDIGAFHGTAVAGILGMMASNTNPDTGQPEGFAGACWHCSIMAVRMINAEGDALGSDAAQAIYYAVDSGADIINASWGVAPGGATPAELQPMREAIEYAAANGVIVIAAAGNGGNAGLYFPANMAEVISVGSSNWNDERSSFSTYAGAGEELDVTAPGELIWTSGVYSAYDAWVANDWLLFPELWWEPYRPGDDVYVGGDGTSFAAPLVSGYAGLILSRNPCATPDQVRTVIRDNAVDIGTPNYDAQTGHGRIRMVVPDLGCGSDTPPSVNITAPAHDSTVSGSVEITASASDDNGVDQVEFFVDGASIGTDTDGTDGWSQAWDTTTYANGAHPVAATATDSIGQTGNDSISATVDNGTATEELHIGDLDGERVDQPRGRWQAVVTVTVHDSADQPYPGATVAGTWSNGASGSGSCQPTDAQGQCQISKGSLKGNVVSVDFTVTDVTTPTGDSYVPASNHDPESDSDGTTITVPNATGPTDPPPDPVIAHVANLQGTSQPGRRNRWDALVEVTVEDAGDQPVAGATVEGNWSGSATGGASCSTATGGTCTLSKTNLKTNSGSVTLTVTNITGTDISYDAGSNATDSVSVSPP